MISKAQTVDEYLSSLPHDRREPIEAVRRTLLANLDPAIEEGMQYGMIGYFVPHSKYPAGYHCDPKQPLPFASLASQKNHMALYLMCEYMSPAEESTLRQEWAATGKKLDMGKSCIRFKKLDDVPLEVVGRAVARVKADDYIAIYEANLAKSGINRQTRSVAVSRSSQKAKSPAGAKKAVAKKTIAKKVASKKKTVKRTAKKGTKALAAKVKSKR